MHDLIRNTAPIRAAQAAHQWIWLCGQPQLQVYLDMIRNKPVGGASFDARTRPARAGGKTKRNR